MRVLLAIGPDRANGTQHTAAQANRTAEGLRALGVDATVSSALASDLSELDLIHLFASEPTEPVFRQALRARGAGLPIVLTPGLWSPSPEGSTGRTDNVLARREQVMRRVVFGLANALTPSSHAELETISALVPTKPARVVTLPDVVDQSVADGLAVAEATLAVYNAVMEEGGQASNSDWRAAFTQEEYIEHLESLIQLQLEAIALRDGHHASAVAYAESLEADRERRELYIASLERGRPGLRQRLAARLGRLRR